MNNQERHDLIDDLASHQDANFSPEQLKELFEIFSKDATNADFSDWIAEKWNSTQEVGDRLSSDSQLPKLVIQKHRRLHKAFILGRNIAAILVIPLALALTFIFTQQPEIKNIVTVGKIAHLSSSTQEYYSPAGTRSKVVLGDSTVVWLNGDSRLLVTENYGMGERRVNLVGQAFFDVRSNKEVPFFVDVDKMSIRVTGTTFSVNSYSPEHVETVLVSGVIEIENAGQSTLMKPSDRIVLTPGVEGVARDKVAVTSYKSWKDGVLIFEDTPMRNVITTLERWFNVDINITDRQILNYRFTAKLDNCSLSQVMEYLTYSSPINYKINKQQVTINKIL